MPQHSYDRYVKANEAAWDEVTPIHGKYRKDEADFFRSGGVTLDKIELGQLPPVKGKKVAHLSCNCGQDTLSLSNLGAECTGFDISKKALEEARNLSEKSGVPAQFVHSDVLDLPTEYDNSFDLVYMSRGALVWLPDLRLLMKNISRILKHGGEVFIHDEHPFVHLLDEELKLAHNYFNTEPEEESGLDYIGNSTYDALPNYQYMIRISDIINGLAENSFRITKFLEHNRNFFKLFPNMVEDADGFYVFPPDLNVPDFPWMMTIRAVRE